jgi:hypothetical protein
LPDTGDGVDGRRHRRKIGGTVVKGGAGSGGGQLDGGHPPVIGVVDALGRLADTDDDGRAGVEGHTVTVYRDAISV